MKECPSCKSKNDNNAVFCAVCGADLKDVPTSSAAFLNKLSGPLQNTAAPGADAAQRKGAGKFVDQSETAVATIGNSYLQNFLSGGDVRKGIGILTQKRFYYMGRNFSGTGKDMKKTTEEGVVSIEDITFTMFSHTRNIGALIVGILLALFGAYLFLVSYDMRGSESDIFGFGGMGLIAMGLLFLVSYFISRKSLFVVSFPGGSFGFDIRYYPIADIRDFQRQLHLLKDYHKENA